MNFRQWQWVAQFRPDFSRGMEEADHQLVVGNLVVGMQVRPCRDEYTYRSQFSQVVCERVLQTGEARDRGLVGDGSSATNELRQPAVWEAQERQMRFLDAQHFEGLDRLTMANADDVSLLRRTAVAQAAVSDDRALHIHSSFGSSLHQQPGANGEVVVVW